MNVLEQLVVALRRGADDLEGMAGRSAQYAVWSRHLREDAASLSLLAQTYQDHTREEWTT